MIYTDKTIDNKLMKNQIAYVLIKIVSLKGFDTSTLNKLIHIENKY